MKKRQSSIDGFIPRRPNSNLGDIHTQKHLHSLEAEGLSRGLHTGNNTAAEAVGSPRKGKQLGVDDLSESLRQIDEFPEEKKLSKRQRRKAARAARRSRPKSRTRRIVKWTVIILLSLGLIAGGYVALRGALAGNSIFEGNIFDIITRSDPLKQDENGRSNFIVFGTAEDDEGGMHGGANLTDSIMVISVSQEKKDAYMISLPRDLWVEYDEICTVGYQGKINAVYYCGSDDGQDETAGAKALQQKVGEILGLDIQYFIHLNFTAVTDGVDAIGGVDVTIESDDPRGILDRNFDWKCNYSCYYVNYQNGETVHLDGEHALALARARNAAGGYGLANGNFDREKNQQKIIKALREKALSAGTLTNLGAVTGLIDALGKNLRTNIQTKEIRTLMDLSSKIPNDDIRSISLNDEGNMLVTTGSYNGQSIVRPIPGLLDFSQIQSYIKRTLTSEAHVKEEAHVSVLNASGAAGVAQAEADKLLDEGFLIDTVGNAPEGTFAAVEVYQLGEEKSASARRLEALYGVTLRTTPPPVSVVGETDFLVIIADSSAGRL